LEFKDSTSKGS